MGKDKNTGINHNDQFGELEKIVSSEIGNLLFTDATINCPGFSATTLETIARSMGSRFSFDMLFPARFIDFNAIKNLEKQVESLAEELNGSDFDEIVLAERGMFNELVKNGLAEIKEKGTKIQEEERRKREHAELMGKLDRISETMDTTLLASTITAAASSVVATKSIHDWLTKK